MSAALWQKMMDRLALVEKDLAELRTLLQETSKPLLTQPYPGKQPQRDNKGH